MKLRNRFPTSHLPEGWFPMGWSHELAKGELKSLHYFDRELVMWRGANDEVAVQDAFCQHLGAHRGVGGEVRGDDLMCPWHGWEWGQDGHNTRIPYSAEGCKKQLKIRTYPVREWCGFIVAWHSLDPEKAPTWEPPEVPEYGRDDFYDAHPFSDQLHRVKAHPQMPMENAVDPAHIAYVHGAGEIPVQDSFFADKHHFQSNVYVTYGHGKEKTRFTPDGPVKIRVEMNCYGVGLSLIRWSEPMPTIQPTAFTPIDGEYMDYYFCQSSRQLQESVSSEPKGLALEFVKMQWNVIVQDFPFWENMNYLEQPHFAAEESKAYSAMRRWAAQFYPEDAQAAMLKAAGPAD
jgi:phenylpropionate dioxygenase-like ring-hydroxylating dioxygenase large terminal subunit